MKRFSILTVLLLFLTLNASSESIWIYSGVGVQQQRGYSSFSLAPAGSLGVDLQYDRFILNGNIGAGQLMGGTAFLGASGAYKHQLSSVWSAGAGLYLNLCYTDYVLYAVEASNLFIPHRFQADAGIRIRPIILQWGKFSLDVLSVSAGTSLNDFFKLLDLDIQFLAFGVRL